MNSSCIFCAQMDLIEKSTTYEHAGSMLISKGDKILLGTSSLISIWLNLMNQVSGMLS